ncbi:site-specific integrase, partial [bacterium D16-51]
PLSKGYLRLFSAVLQNSFRFAVFPKRYITFNPMQYVVMRGKKEDVELFAEDSTEENPTPTITHEQYHDLLDYLRKKNNPAILPIQIAYYTGLRIGEVCGLTWQDINLEEQYLTVRRSLRYNNTRHKYEIGATKRKKVRIVDFCDTLAEILKKAKREQHRQRFRYGELYHCNYYKQVTDKGRMYYEVYTQQNTENVPEGYEEISFVCLRPDGAAEYPTTVGTVCRAARKKVKGLEDFHFHMLRHTYTSNLLSNGAAPKDVQELLGHADVSTTMNVYAHATREAKRTSARLLDKVVGGN